MKNSVSRHLGVCCLGLFAVALVVCKTKSVDNSVTNTNPEGVLYVLNQDDNSMYVYDSHTMTLVDSFKTNLPAAPHHMEFDPQHHFAYIVGRTSPGQITKFDIGGDSVVTKIVAPSPLFPTSMVVSANGRVGYVCDFTTGGGGHLHRIDLTTMVFTDSSDQTGLQTHDIKATLDRNTLVMANYNTDNVTVIKLNDPDNTNDDSVYFVDCNPVGNNPGVVEEGPYGIAIDPNDSLVYIGCRISRKVRVMDLKTRTIVDSIAVPGTGVQPAGPSLMCINSSNTKLYVATQNDNNLIIINLTNRTIAKTIPLSAKQPFGVQLSEDESRLYVTCPNNTPPGQPGRVYMLDASTDAMMDSIDVGHGSFMSHQHAAHH